MTPTVAVVRGAFLNAYEMQLFAPLTDSYEITAFGSKRPYHEDFPFPVAKLWSPMDLPDSRYKMPILNRMFVDAHYLVGLERKLAGFDLVHSAETYYHYTQQALRAKRQGRVKRVIATVLENIPHNNEGIWGRKAFKKRAREELDHIIALTKKTRDALIAEGADEDKITVVPHGIDTRVFTPRKRKRGDGPLEILFAGRIEEYKGVLDIVGAAMQLMSDPILRDKPFRIRMVGDGTRRATVKHLVQTLGLGKVFSFDTYEYRDMPRVYRDADIFIAPSKPRITMAHGRQVMTWDEQYCTALLEAQAAGLPIVTTDTGGIPENVGEAAVLVPPGDTDAITDALKQFLTSPKLRTTYGRNARNRAERIHDVRIISARIAAVYDRVLKN